MNFYSIFIAFDHLDYTNNELYFIVF